MYYAKTKRRHKLPSNDTSDREGQKAKRSTGRDASNGAVTGDTLQGEGNYDAAREFNAAQRRFVQSGKVASAARAATPKGDAERQQMLEAEAQAKSRAKEDYPPPPETRPPGWDAARSEPSKDAPRRRR
jgi:hypothetical protein